MKLKNVLVIAALFGGTCAMAQSDKTPSEPRVDRTEAMVVELGLEGKQAEEYRALVHANAAEMKELRNAERDGLHDRAKELRDKHEQDIKAILTTEQWETYQTKKAKEHANSVQRAEEMKRKEGKLKQSINE